MGNLYLVRTNEISVLSTDTLWKTTTTPTKGWNTNSVSDVNWDLSVTAIALKGKEALPWFAAQPGSQYDLEYKMIPGFKEWNTQPIVQKTPYINDVLMSIDYVSDAIAVYSSNKLVNDEYWNGRTWMFSLGRISTDYSAPLKIQLSPIFPQMDVFLEDRFKKDLNTDYYSAIKEIKLIPEYKVVVTTK